jgi:3,4-dihydroxy 2-butanone 4-phosphate synthase/GTP cyclohydrolase II
MTKSETTTPKESAPAAAKDSTEVVLDFEKLPAWLHEYFVYASHQYPEEQVEHPMHGTTVFVAETVVPTRFGDFKVSIFQDIIHKGYILALCYGDVRSADTLYTRMHSSCVTSETLGGCDCDCVQQLEGAMEKISKSGQGVLFYLLQEGRGVGYSAKARDRMLVQASGDTLSTFEAYRILGLKKDYRQYLNIKDIVHILGIEAEWVVLTNNPDKVAAMKRNGLTVKRMENIEFEPGPFNLFYLKSKQDSGHTLNKPNDTAIARMELPEKVKPFKPRRLESAQRFIYMASYLLPIRHIDNEVVMNSDAILQTIGDTDLQRYTTGVNPPIHSFEALRGNRLKLKINPAEINRRVKENPEDPLGRLMLEPYWFRVHVYFDLVSGDDFVVLTHGNPKSYERPIVRIQSESILDRFPVKLDDNKAKYQRAI